MKRILIVTAVVVATLVIFGAGFAFAQYQSVSAAGYGPGMMGWNPQASGTPAPYAPGYGMMGGGRGMMGGRDGNGYGPAHTYVVEALAGKLGLTVDEVNAQLTAGKTMAQVAQDKGIAAADLPALFNEVHKTAFNQAVAAGVMTQAQADWMLQNMQTRWDDGMPCLDGAQTGQGYGPGMMGHRRGGWNQQAPQTNP